MSRTIKQPYRHSRRFDASCRNQGACPYCAMGRQHTTKRQAAEAGEPETKLPPVSHLLSDNRYHPWKEGWGDEDTVEFA